MTDSPRTPFAQLLTLVSVRVKPRWTILALLAAIGLVGSTTGARQARPDGPPNFDVRTEKSRSAGAFVARYLPPQRDALQKRMDGLGRLQALYATLDVENSPESGTPEVIGRPAGHGFLTGPSNDRVGTMRAFLSTFSDAFGLTPAEVASLELVANYANPAGNMAWVELEQRINGIPVFRALIRGGFTAKGELARTTGPLAAGLAGVALPTSPGLTAAQAVSQAAATVNWNIPQSNLAERGPDSAGKIRLARTDSPNDARAWLVYFPIGPGAARLAWATEIMGDPDTYLIVVDAEDGTLLFRKNQTNYQTQAVTYHVYADDSPAPSSPTLAIPGANFQAPLINRAMITLIGNEGPNSFNNLGWMNDGTNLTDGNNVQAGLDRDGVDGVDAAIAGSSFRVFNFAYNPGPGNPAPGDDPLTAGYQNGEITDAFYWTNLYHDKLYLLGFTEAARNFQNDNFGRGGVAADRVRGEIQDSSGTNNANFSTSSDGVRGRMQMYIFPGPTPDRTSALDHDVLLHELTHGTSNRLHNNAAGLNTLQAVGMGEGWSDFYARALLSTADENPAAVYTTGGWVTNLITAGYTDNYYYGIRRFPYAIMSTRGANGKPHNPLTFADIDPSQFNVTNGAYPMNPAPIFGGPNEVHNIGEVWAIALLEVRALYIQRLGFVVGNQRFLQFVTDGMKLDPVSPSILQARNSILTAAAAGGGSAADIDDIWTGFAIRGMGYSASTPGSTSSSVVEAFDVPGLAANGGSLVAESIPNGRLDAGETITVSVCVTNNAGSTSGAVTGTLQPGGGVQNPTGPQSFGAIAPAGNACNTFSLIVGAGCGTTLTATMQAQEAGGLTRSLRYTFGVGSQSPVTSENFDGVAAPTLPAGWSSATIGGTPNLFTTVASSSDTPPNRAFAGDPAFITDNVLVSPVIAVPANATFVSFRNNYALEAGFDGGVLEVSINGGAYADIITAGGSFVSGGYTAVISSSFGSPIGGRQAWSGTSGAYVTSTVALPPSALGQNINLRWRVATDDSVASTGWSVDTLSVFQFACSSQAPTVTGHPQSQTVMSGGTATMTVVAAGSGTITYQWYNGLSGNTSSPIGGANSASYTTPPLFAPANYWVQVGNGIGLANSNTATISVGPGALSNIILNGDFSAGGNNWLVFEQPDIQFNITGGVFQYYRQNPTTTASGQAVVFQNTNQPIAANTPLRAVFDIGNSSTARKRISVLIIDGDFSDITVCTFWLAPGAPMRTYSMRTHTTKNWSNAAIYFYAATKGQDGGFYQLDNVLMAYDPAVSATQSTCVDPTAPAPPGGSPGPELMVNGHFQSGMTGWIAFGSMTSQVAGGVFEYIRPSPLPTPAGVIYQNTGVALPVNTIVTATMQFGNSSSVRKRVTVLLQDADFSDLTACTFWLAPNQPLRPYVVRGFATKVWANATLAIYNASVGGQTWTRVDNVTFSTTPGTAALGTECIEPPPGTPFVGDSGGKGEDAPPPPGGIAGGSPERPETTGRWWIDAGESGRGAMQWGRPIDLTDASGATLSFDSRLSHWGASGEVQATLDGVTWESVADIGNDDGRVAVDLSRYAGRVVYVRFVVTAGRMNRSDAWSIGDVALIVR